MYKRQVHHRRLQFDTLPCCRPPQSNVADTIINCAFAPDKWFDIPLLPPKRPVLPKTLHSEKTNGTLKLESSTIIVKEGIENEENLLRIVLLGWFMLLWVVMHIIHMLR